MNFTSGKYLNFAILIFQFNGNTVITSEILYLNKSIQHYNVQNGNYCYFNMVLQIKL